jgi:hypothetical protein
VQAWADDFSAQERLQAIREALIEAAMQSNTHVSSTSWVNAEGVLNKYDRFSSDVSVKDVQTQSLERDKDGQVRAHIDSNSMTPEMNATCDAPLAKSHLRQVMLLDIATGEQIPATNRYRAQQLKNLVQEKLVQAGGSSSNFRLVVAPAYTPGVRPSAYERASYIHDEDQVSWIMRVRLQSAPSSHVTDTSSNFQLDISVFKQARTQAWWHGSRVIYSEVESHRVGDNQVTQDTSDELAQSVQALSEELNQVLACQSPSFKVSHQGQSWTINAGELAGLHVGDRLFLADVKVLPEHALEQGALDESMLAEVKAVSAYKAELRPVAGRSQDHPNEWVAWPYTY